MKVVILTDTHWGVRNDHQAFLDNQKLFLDNVFFPTIDERKIHTVIHLGDLVDRRKYINYITASRLRKDFLEPLRERALDVDILLGNHDVYFKDTNKVNALKELVAPYNNITIFDKAEVTDLYGLKVLYLPWICADNQEHAAELIQETDAQICMGHLEIAGFEMYRGMPAHEGLDPDVFKKFDLTFSGHFHHKSKSGGIHYLGAMSEHNWSDYDDPRGFHIFDTETRELEFIINPHRMFVKLFYSDAQETPDVDITGKFVKVVVREKNSAEAFDMYIDALEKHAPLQIQIVDDHLNLDLGQDETIVDEAEDTLTIFKRAVNQSNSIGVDPARLNEFIVNLYSEALQVE